MNKTTDTGATFAIVCSRSQTKLLLVRIDKKKDTLTKRNTKKKQTDAFPQQVNKFTHPFYTAAPGDHNSGVDAEISQEKESQHQSVVNEGN